MSAILSPEQYLRYPVQVSLVDRSYRTPETQDTENESGCPPWICEQIKYSPRYEDPWVNALRSARFESINADLELLNGCEDPTNTYCVPVVNVMNSVVFKDDTPELRLLRSPRSKLLDYPVAVLYSGMQDICPFSETAHLQVDRWHKRTVPHDEQRKVKKRGRLDWTKVKKCLAVIVFLHPGELVLDDVCVEHNNVQITDVNLRRAFRTLMTAVQNTRAAVGILTDELTSLFVDYLPCQYDEDLPELVMVPPSTTDLRMLISSLIYYEANSWNLVRIHSTAARRFLHGAHMDEAFLKSFLDTFQVESKRWFSDFDLYTMQRVPELWFKFASWRQRVQEEGLKHLVSSGMSITFESDGFPRRHGLLRSPYPHRPLPQETVDSVLTYRERRPRNTTLDEIICKSRHTALVVQEAMRTGPEHFSQVFSAYVPGCSELVCVKLFDERFFCIPGVREDECISGPARSRLGSLHYSEDLARHEESVYYRLSYLQGTLLPHCYGFHLFTMPDGWQCYGLIMEKIQGLPLAQIFQTSAPAVQMSLISQMRHGVRALRAAGVSQRDWHLNQILCSLHGHEHPQIVLIDFGFSEVYVGDENGTPTTYDFSDVWGLLYLRLNVTRDTLDKHWLPPSEFEY
ncbi:hypothetical protein NM688_g9387 [Phlebia brevispora]|uniref:Uncharacterized protein n=1 Tax=Phlebia brevispora TaxID=194682 RepID=A0ACC1RI62_9APHY|nr:hypothetical protein NM688_g9387 [Phlebia brevispora]